MHAAKYLMERSLTQVIYLSLSFFQQCDYHSQIGGHFGLSYNIWHAWHTSARVSWHKLAMLFQRTTWHLFLLCIHHHNHKQRDFTKIFSSVKRTFCSAEHCKMYSYPDVSVSHLSVNRCDQIINWCRLAQNTFCWSIKRSFIDLTPFGCTHLLIFLFSLLQHIICLVFSC